MIQVNREELLKMNSDELALVNREDMKNLISRK